MSVIDTSPGHDWTSVAVIDLPSGIYGRDYPAYGFVYPGTSPREVVAASDSGEHNGYGVDGRVSLDFSAQPALLGVAFTSEREQPDIHGATSTKGNKHRKRRARRSQGLGGPRPSSLDLARQLGHACGSHVIATPGYARALAIR
jgi:hypothetical protein